VNFQYIVLRLIRHFMPEWFARYLLRRRWILQPGLELSDPIAAVNRYVEVLSEHGCSINGQRVLVFGYGGRFAIGVELLKRGAGHVILCDHFISLDKQRNLKLYPAYEKYLILTNVGVEPRSQYITLLHGDIRDNTRWSQIQKADCVLSTSVFEHLQDLDGITKALSTLTDRDGLQLHFVDLRDHYFKRPFEMLTFSQRVWISFLNPTSHLNRLRLTDYQKVFGMHFKKVDIQVLERDQEEFEKTRPRIRPEFMTGDPSIDSVTLIRVIATHPIR
jgi:hypothetical protein